MAETPAGVVPERTWYAVPGVAMAAGVFAGLSLPFAVAEKAGMLLLAVSLLFCGLPHGAGDLWALRLAAPRALWSARRRGWLMAAYLAASSITLLLWWCEPMLSLAVFLVLTAWHFGSADALLLTGGVARGGVWWVQAVGRGALVVCAPLAFHQYESARLLEPFALQDANAQAELIRFLLEWGPAFAAAAIGLQVLAAAPGILARPAGHVTGDRWRAVAALGETCLIALLFWSAPPLLAFACYWIGVHAWRHVLRIEALQWGAAPGTAAPPVWRLVLDYHERTLGMTLLAVAGLAVVFLIWPPLATGANGWITAYFLLLSALTVPHALVIAYLDRRTRLPFAQRPAIAPVS